MIKELIHFTIENYFVVLYAITWIVSVITYRKYFDTHLKYFPILVAYTFFNELLGYMIRFYPDFSFFNDTKYQYNREVLYNIYAVIFFSYFYYIYWKLTLRPKFKNQIRNAAIVVGLSFIISCLFQNPMDVSLFYSISLSAFVLIYCIALYFNDQYIHYQKVIQVRNLVFWVSLGMASLYVFFPFLYLIGYLNLYIWKTYHLLTILRGLIVIMNVLIIIGFLISKRPAFR